MLYHRRKNLRLPYFDYSQYGCYFVTICTKNRKLAFGQITNEEMNLNEIGLMVEKELMALLKEYPHSELSNYVIMPNHLHFIWFNKDNVNLSDLVRKLKGRTATQFRKLTGNINDESLWQRSFYEHIIRDEQDFQRIWEYIENNPLQWHLDRFYS